MGSRYDRKRRYERSVQHIVTLHVPGEETVREFEAVCPMDGYHAGLTNVEQIRYRTADNSSVSNSTVRGRSTVNGDRRWRGDGRIDRSRGRERPDRERPVPAGSRTGELFKPDLQTADNTARTLRPGHGSGARLP